MGKQWIGPMLAVGLIVVCAVVCVVHFTREMRHRLSSDEVNGGSIAFGADTENMAVEVGFIKNSSLFEELTSVIPVPPPTEPATSAGEIAVETPEPWQPDVTQRIRENKRIVEKHIRRFEELRRRAEEAYLVLSGYRDGVHRTLSESAESRVVLAYGGQLTSQTTRLRVVIDDSITDLRALVMHEETQQSRFTYVSTLVWDPEQRIDPERLSRNTHVVYEWLVRYANSLREIEREWREGLRPAYVALEEMLAAELERARQRHDDILRPPPNKENASSAEESGSK